MRKTIFALVLSAVSVVFGIALAGAGGSPAAAETGAADAAGVATSAESAVTQVQQESPEPDASPEDNADGERNRDGDHNCPDRDGDGEPDAREDGQTSLNQA